MNIFIKKFLAVFLLSFIFLFFGVNLVQATIGDPCDCDEGAPCGDCGAGEECICDPNPGDGTQEGKCQIACTGICIRNPLKVCTFGQLINKIIDFLFVAALAIVPLMIVIAGFYFVTAAGNPQRVETAKRIILYTSIGFLIILLSKALIAALQKAIGG